MTDKHGKGIIDIMRNSGRLMYLDLRGNTFDHDAYKIIDFLTIINPFIMNVRIGEIKYDSDVF